MKSYADALAQVLSAAREARPLAVERLPLRQAAGRVLAEAVRAAEGLPSFDNSAMDGYAVVAAATPGEFEVAATLLAGDAPAPVGTGARACEIMTGAPMPLGPWDAVVRVEDVAVERDASGRPVRVRVLSKVGAGDHVRRAGSDVRAGDPILPAGTRVTPHHILALAALGIAEVPVRRRPRAAVLSTGRELVGCDTPVLRPGMIRNSTGPFLEAALRTGYGAEILDLGICPDDAETFEGAVRQALDAGADLMITTGAVSMGKHDFVAEALGSMGARILFHRLAIRPGKPVLFARLSGTGGCAFFGLPGNPVSTAVGLRFLAGPYLRAVQGEPEEAPERLRLLENVLKPEGLRCFFKARRQGARVVALAGQESYRVAPLLEANAWVVLPESGRLAPAGSEAEVYPLLPGADPAGADRLS